MKRRYAIDVGRRDNGRRDILEDVVLLPKLYASISRCCRVKQRLARAVHATLLDTSGGYGMAERNLGASWNTGGPPVFTFVYLRLISKATQQLSLHSPPSAHPVRTQAQEHIAFQLPHLVEQPLKDAEYIRKVSQEAMGRSKRGARHDSAASAAQRRLQVCMPASLAEARPPCSLGHITGVPCDYMVVLQEAETMQQRGERRKGEEAMAHLSRAVDAYRDAMGMNLTESDQTNAIVLCAECLQQMAAQAQAAEAARSDASQSAEGEATACKLARQSLQQAVQAGDHSALHFSR
jgi:hypothetical protein